MELRDLQCFLALAEELSFTRAARRLRVAQPALSLRIKQFEQELGAPLFNRTKRKVELSEAGVAMEPRARQILAASHDAAGAVRMIAAGQSGVLKIGAFYSAIYTVLPRIITLDPQFNMDFYTATLTAFTARGLSPRIVNKAPDMHLVLGLVSAGLGVSLVPSSIAEINHKYIVFKKLTDNLPEMTIQLAWLGQNGSPIVSHFAEKAGEIYKVRPRGKAPVGAL